MKKLLICLVALIVISFGTQVCAEDTNCCPTPPPGPVCDLVYGNFNFDGAISYINDTDGLSMTGSHEGHSSYCGKCSTWGEAGGQGITEVGITQLENGVKFTVQSQGISWSERN